MAENVGYATLDVIPSMRGARAELERQTRGQFEPVGRNAGRRFGKAMSDQAGDEIRTGLIPKMRSLAGPLAAAAGGIGVATIFKGAIDGASDLQETLSKVGVVLGDGADDVRAFASDAERNILLTEQAALDAASTFAILGKSAGLAGTDLASFSTDLTSLASDLASFHDTSTEQAIQALGAAMRGEAEPIRAYGVLLDDARLRDEALRQGLIKTTKDALTPQQKVLAANALIFEQTRDAQGDAARTSDGYANSVRRLQKSLSEMQTELGQKALPVLTSGAQVLNDDVLPAFRSAGGFVADAARAFGNLPGPVQAAAGALVAFRVAQATGLTGSLASQSARTLGTLRSGMDTLRLRTMLATDEYRRMRTAQLNFVNGAPQFVAASGRMRAAMGALGTAAVGAGTGLRRGLSGAMALVGGPWGLALAGGTLALTHFWGEHRKAKAEVEAFTQSLDEESGALTDLSQKLIFENLRDSGAIEGAKELGIALGDLQAAAEGDLDALSRVNAIIGEIRSGRGLSDGSGDVFGIGRLFRSDDTNAANDIRDALADVNGLVDEGQAAWDDYAEATGDATRVGAEGSRTARDTMADYLGEIRKARQEAQELFDVENERRNAALRDRRDAIGLQQALADVGTELEENGRAIDITTQAGRDNRSALFDLAQQWNDTEEAARDSVGGYEGMRRKFIELATQIGFTKADAKALADEILEIPEERRPKVNLQHEQALARLAELDRRANAVTRPRTLPIHVQLATGAAQAAIDALNDSLGGLVTIPNPPSGRTAGPVVHVENQTVQPHNYNEFLVEQQRRAELYAIGGL